MIGVQSQYERGSFASLDASSAFVGDRVEAQAGGQHQALLGAADGDVDAPLVVAVVDADASDEIVSTSSSASWSPMRRAHVRDPAT